MYPLRAAATSPAPLPASWPTASGLGADSAPKWPAGGCCSRSGLPKSQRRAGRRNAHSSIEDTAASRVTGRQQAEVPPRPHCVANVSLDMKLHRLFERLRPALTPDEGQGMGEDAR